MGEAAFFLVWRQGGNVPTHPHLSRDAAVNEAARLARTLPGERFYVLQAVEAVTKIDVVRTALDAPFDDVVPF